MIHLCDVHEMMTFDFDKELLSDSSLAIICRLKSVDGVHVKID